MRRYSHRPCWHMPTSSLRSSQLDQAHAAADGRSLGRPGHVRRGQGPHVAPGARLRQQASLTLKGGGNLPADVTMDFAKSNREREATCSRSIPRDVFAPPAYGNFAQPILVAIVSRLSPARSVRLVSHASPFLHGAQGSPG